MTFYDDYLQLMKPWSDMQENMPYLYQTARDLGGPIIELGTRAGLSTSAFLAGLEDSGNDGGVWSVDINEVSAPTWWHGCPQWHFLQADDVSPAAKEWLPQRASILFIDSSHEYEHTLLELRTFVPRVRPGGRVLMHDTIYLPGRAQGVPNGPVADALNTYCAEADIETWDNRGGCYGMGVINI